MEDAGCVIYEVIIRVSGTEEIYAVETDARERLKDIGDNLVGVCLVYRSVKAAGLVKWES